MCERDSSSFSWAWQGALQCPSLCRFPGDAGEPGRAPHQPLVASPGVGSPQVSREQAPGGVPGGPLPLLTTSLSHFSFTLGCFFLLTALHIYANYRAVRALVIETLNEGRLWLVLKHFLQRGEVLDPTSANQMEPLWTGDPAPWFPVLCLSICPPAWDS